MGQWRRVGCALAHRYDTANLQKNIQTPKVKADLCGMQLLRKRHAVATKKAYS